MQRQDINERNQFLVLNKHSNVRDFISDYDSINCLVVNWAMFGNNNLKDFSPNNCSVIERFTMRAPINHQFKSICKLYPEMKHQIHWTINSWVDTNFNSGIDEYNYSGKYEIAQLNHYFTKTFPEPTALTIPEQCAMSESPTLVIAGILYPSYSMCP
jgi:hypothetical protein